MIVDEPQVQRRVGRYEIVREVGRGATAVVYLARQSDLDRDVALKELAGMHAADPAFIERFLRESRLAASLNHPNVVTVHEYFEHDGTAFIAMEYLERGSLRPLIGTLTLPQVAGVLEGLLAGLAYAETRGVVHRDLKPENVMVTSTGAVKIADFGVAKAIEGSGAGPLTLSGTTVGTPAYMAPEQALAASVGSAADRYSVGVIAYELLTGDVPFHEDVALALLLRHVNDPVPSPRAVRPDLDPALSRWVERMLAKEPEARPASAAEAWDELEEIVVGVLDPRWGRQSRLTQTPVAAARSTAVTRSVQQPARRRRRTRAWAALAAAVALAGLAGGVGAAVALSDGETTTPTTSTEPPQRAEKQAAPRPQPVAHATVNRVRIAERGDDVVATLRSTGKALGAGAVLRHDSDISDGHAWFELRGREIAATTGGGEHDSLRVRVRKGANRLRVDVSAEAGAFERFRVRRVDGRTVAITVTEPEPAVEPTPAPPDTTYEPPRETTPTEPDEPKDPPIKTG